MNSSKWIPSLLLLIFVVGSFATEDLVGVSDLKVDEKQINTLKEPKEHKLIQLDATIVSNPRELSVVHQTGGLTNVHRIEAGVYVIDYTALNLTLVSNVFVSVISSHPFTYSITRPVYLNQCRIIFYHQKSEEKIKYLSISVPSDPDGFFFHVRGH